MSASVRGRLLAWALGVGCAVVWSACGGVPRAGEFQDPTQAHAAVKPKVAEGSEAQDPRVVAAIPKLEGYLRRALSAPSLELVQARPFSEGHINETWYLAFERSGGALESAVLKIFAERSAADANAAQFVRAGELTWPVPTQMARGTAAPYNDKPALLMEFVAGGTLEARLRQLFDKGHRPFPDEVAALYGDVARAIGILHRQQRRRRKPGDRSGKAAMEGMIERCKAGGWCGAEAVARFVELSKVIDAGSVSFIHGDLYESQVVLKPASAKRSHIMVAAFIDLDESGYGDPAVDLGSLLGHVLLIHPRTRWKAWGVPDPSGDETETVARRILDEYKEGARLSDEQWGAFAQRARGWMWLRLNNVMVKYGDSPQAKDLLTALNALGPELTAHDPLEAMLAE